MVQLAKEKGWVDDSRLIEVQTQFRRVANSGLNLCADESVGPELICPVDEKMLSVAVDKPPADLTKTQDQLGRKDDIAEQVYHTVSQVNSSGQLNLRLNQNKARLEQNLNLIKR